MLELWATAVCSYGIPPEEALDLTPAQIWALGRANLLNDFKADRRAATVAAVIANVHRPKNRRAYKPDDFMADYKALFGGAKGGSKMSSEQMAKMFETIATIHNSRLDRRGKAHGG